VLLHLFRAPALGRVILGRLPVAPSGRVSVEVEALDAGWLRVGGARRFVSSGGSWIFRAAPGSEVRVVYRTLVGTCSTRLFVPHASLPEAPALPVVGAPRFRVFRTPSLRRPLPAPGLRYVPLPRLQRRPLPALDTLRRGVLPRVPSLRVHADGDAMSAAFGALPPQSILRNDRAALVALGAALVEQHLHERTSP
jgi:hypothetical protein